MEQLNNNAALTMLQTVPAQTQTQQPKAAKSDGDSDFQKLMDKAASGAKETQQVEDTAKTETPAAGKSEEAPVQKEEDALTQIKRMLEQNGAFAFQPSWPCDCVDTETGETVAAYNPGEYVMVFTGENFEIVPTVDLEPWQQAQLKQLLIDPNPIDVSDPKVDAMLEFTAPDADNRPAAVLEKVTADRFGKVVREMVDRPADVKAAEPVVEPEFEIAAEPEFEIAAEPEFEFGFGVVAKPVTVTEFEPEFEVEMEPQQQIAFVPVEDDSTEAEATVIDADQAPQQLFHDVKAAPVKVGEVYEAPKTETNVAKQVDLGVAQAMEKGESLVRIQLNPENLGSVTVEITRSTEGIIHVALNARSSETRHLLERHAGELQSLVANRTQQDVEVNVQRHQESQQSQNQQNYDGHNGHAQHGQEQRRRRQEQTSSQDFIQQLRLGLISMDGE